MKRLRNRNDQKKCTVIPGTGGGIPYIRMIEMIVVFLEVKIFRGSSSEYIKRIKPVFVRL